MSRRNYLFVNVVWGDAYTQSYLEATMPTELLPDNVPAFCEDTTSRYRIYTVERCRKIIEASPVFARLRQLIAVDFIDIVKVFGQDPEQNSNPLLFAECHYHAVNSTLADNLGIIFLAPDAVWSNGSFVNFLNYAKPSIRAVMCYTGLRVAKEAFLPKLREHLAQPDATLSGQDLVRIATTCPHPDQLLQTWSHASNPNSYSGNIWPVEGEGLIVRGFHCHPVIVWPDGQRAKATGGTIDGDYIDRLCEDTAAVALIRDSDEACVFEYTSADAQRFVNRKGESSQINLAKWGVDHASPMHIHLGRTTQRFHQNNEVSQAWLAQEQAIADIVNPVCDWLAGKIAPTQANWWRCQAYRFYRWQKRVIRTPERFVKKIFRNGKR